MNKEELKKYLKDNQKVLTELIKEIDCYCNCLENLKFTNDHALPELKEEINDCIIKEVVNALDSVYDLICIEDKVIQKYIENIEE